MDDPEPMFAALDKSDAELAEAIANELGFALPPECEPGVAANARILQRHAEILRRSGE